MQGFGNKIIKNTGSTKKLKISYAIVKIAVQSKNSDGNKQLIFLDKEWCLVIRTLRKLRMS